jgi:hypothetical protein
MNFAVTISLLNDVKIYKIEMYLFCVYTDFQNILNITLLETSDAIYHVRST